MKDGLMEKKPITRETKANRQRKEGWQPGEEPRRRGGEGGDCAGRGGLAWTFIKERADGETREAWPVTKPVNYTGIIPRPLGRNPQVTSQGKRRRKINLDTKAILAFWFERRSVLSWVKERPRYVYPRCIAKKSHTSCQSRCTSTNGASPP